MRRKVSIAEARDHLTAIVKDAEKGKAIELTRRGKPVAVLISASEYEHLRRERPSPADAYRRWRAKHPEGIEGFTKKELAELRDRSPGRDFSFP